MISFFVKLALFTAIQSLAERVKSGRGAPSTDVGLDPDMTCKRGNRDLCNGDWLFVNGKCCTSKWATCTKSDPYNCKQPWTYLGIDDQCCLTTYNQVWFTEMKSDPYWCKGDWTFLGGPSGDNCVTTKWAKCTKGDPYLCKKPWTYLGTDDQCCLTTDHQVWLTEMKADPYLCKGE